MKIDKEKILNLFRKNYTTPREIDEVLDTSKYIFITHKHKDYEPDDERGMVFGSGPIVYNKETKKYYATFGIDFILDDYQKYLDEISDKIPKPDLTKIKEGIIRRNYINQSDIENFIEINNYEQIEFEIRNSEDYDHNNRKVIIKSKNIKLLNSLSHFLNLTKIEHTFISNNKMLVNQIKNM